jgi:O-antigen/teichoic acid export membrane protein
MTSSLLEAEPAPDSADVLPEESAGERDVAAPVAGLHDRLAVGMAYLLVLAVLQRGVGLVRNILVCRVLGPEELGRWNLAFAFLMLAGPLAVLGLPGTFGRYVEHFRKRGRLRTFLRRTGLASAALAIVAIGIILAAPGPFAEIVFRDFAQSRLMLISALTLGAVIAFNYFTELFTALRRSRVASTMQFAHSLIFTIVGLAFLATTWPAADAVVFAYGVACVLACLGAVSALRESSQAAPLADGSLPQMQFWAKLAPFACWIWATNLLVNLSDVADRYMILYFAAGDASAASALVGQYHSSRIAPDLLASLAAMVAAVMLPYNSHDWEAGNREAVSVRVRLAIKAMSVVFLAAGVALLTVAQPLFDRLLGGKYAAGEALLPWTMVLCSYFGLTILAMNYLWCAERAGRAVAVMGMGLIVNIALNLLLLPRLGLPGAVIATAVANAATLALTLRFNSRLAMQLDAGVFLAGLAPLSLLLGPAAAAGTLIVLVFLSFHSPRILPQAERIHFVLAFQLFERHRLRGREPG